MKYLLKLTIVISILSILNISAQSKYVADRYFKEFDYIEAAEAYKNIYNRGDRTYEVVSRLADSYYFNTEVEKAEKWYAIMYTRFADEMEVEHLFRYAQVLKGMNKYTEADAVMTKINHLDSFDSRPKKLEKKPRYLFEYTSEPIEVLSFNNLETNTKYSDFGGFVYKGQLYFASAKKNKYWSKIYKWNDQPFLNLYKGTISTNYTNGFQVKKSVMMDKPLNTKYHDAAAIITKDGKTMYFTRDNHNKNITGMSKERNVLLKLYRATLIDGKWKNIIELPFNNDEYSVGHPALSTDEKTLYFVSNMPGGYGATDIYKVDILGDNKYSEPQNLGNRINTEGREMFPFVSNDNVLYFASDGHLGLGGLDIFESAILEDFSFGRVKNLKEPFNSELDDFAFYINKDNKAGFLSSNRKEGKGDDDIYSFVLKKPKMINPLNLNCKQVLTGVVTDSNSGEILPNAKVNLIDYEGKVIESVKTDNEGMYSFKVKCSNNYRVVGTKINYRKDLKVLNTNETDKYANLLNLTLVPLIKNKILAIQPIYFDYDKSNIRPDSQFELENVVAVMKANPNMVISIESHTDARGSREYNKKLSESRAKRTQSYLTYRGIEPHRIKSAIGYGEERLLNHCDDEHIKKCTEEEHQLNRRSYFIIESGAPDVKVRNVKPTIIDYK